MRRRQAVRSPMTCTTATTSVGLSTVTSQYYLCRGDILRQLGTSVELYEPFFSFSVSIIFLNIKRTHFWKRRRSLSTNTKYQLYEARNTWFCRFPLFSSTVVTTGHINWLLPLFSAIDKNWKLWNKRVSHLRPGYSTAVRCSQMSTSNHATSH